MLLARPARWLPHARHALGGAAAVAVIVASGLWLHAGQDDRGDTLRLTADAKYYHAYLPSLVLDRDLDLTPQYEVTRNWYGFDDTDLGRPGNVFGIGPAVFSSPFFLAGHAYARLTGEEADGFSRPEVVATLSASWVASLAALIPAALLIRRRLGSQNMAWVVPLLIAAAGPVVYYAIRQPGYAHPFAMLFVAWLVERWDASFRGEASAPPRSLGTWVVLGALIGASALARPQCALWAVILFVAAGDDVRRVLARRPEDWPGGLREVAVCVVPRWLAGAAVSLLVFSPQLLAWNAIYGSFYTVPQGDGFMWWGDPAWSEVLFSSRNGLFPWAPLYALAGAGLAVAAVRTPRVGLVLAVGLAVQTVANGAVWDWWAGGSYGGRRFDSAFVVFAYGFAALAVAPGGPGVWRRVWAAGAALAVALAVVLAVANILLANQYSAPNARIYGGEPASEIIEERLPGPLGAVAGASSRAANAPARYAFAWRYGVHATAYDRVVGVHALGELYPGLNRIRGREQDSVSLDPQQPGVIGLSPECDGCAATVTDQDARVLVALNRRDEITFALRAAAPEGGAGARATLVLNGASIADAELSEETTRIEGLAPKVRRGVNVLEIRAPAGTALHSLRVEGTPDPRGPAAPE